jgi:AMP deaminase
LDSAEDDFQELESSSTLRRPGIDGGGSTHGVTPNPQSHRKSQQDPPARERPPEGQAWPYRDTLSFTRSLIFYGAGAVTHEHEQACRHIEEARDFRQKYMGGVGTTTNLDDLKEKNLKFRFGTEGVAEIFRESDESMDQNLCIVPNIEEFHRDYTRLVEISNEGAMRSFCFQRLQILSTAFRMHVTMTAQVEMQEQSNLLGTDFYRTLKIDNHIHAAAAPSAKQFVDFVRNKLNTEGDVVVCNDGKTTLNEVFDNAGLDRDHLTIDAFNVLADYSVYQRFDNFNAKYSPFRMADMRRIFLKTTNFIGGRYFAELLKIVLNRHETGKGHNSACEMRLSIYGMERHEWKDLAEWMLKDWEHPNFPGPVISSCNRWMIQIPRLWRIYCSKPGKTDRSFLEMIENIFAPMFEATLYPDEHPEVAECLKHIVGIDSVDDEGSHEVSTYLKYHTMYLFVTVTIKHSHLALILTLSGSMPWI